MPAASGVGHAGWVAAAAADVCSLGLLEQPVLEFVKLGPTLSCSSSWACHCAQELTKQPDAESREEVERAVKKRVMGNMRLISELYKLDMVKDWIMTYCIEELLAAPKGKLPPEDNIEVRVCLLVCVCVGRVCMCVCVCLQRSPATLSGHAHSLTIQGFPECPVVSKCEGMNCATTIVAGFLR